MHRGPWGGEAGKGLSAIWLNRCAQGPLGPALWESCIFQVGTLFLLLIAVNEGHAQAKAHTKSREGPAHLSPKMDQYPNLSAPMMQQPMQMQMQQPQMAPQFPGGGYPPPQSNQMQAAPQQAGQPPGVTLMLVNVPPGVRVGEQMVVMTPAGQQYMVVVPQGAAPGSQFQIAVPYEHLDAAAASVRADAGHAGHAGHAGAAGDGAERGDGRRDADGRRPRRARLPARLRLRRGARARRGRARARAEAQGQGPEPRAAAAVAVQPVHEERGGADQADPARALAQGGLQGGREELGPLRSEPAAEEAGGRGGGRRAGGGGGRGGAGAGEEGEEAEGEDGEAGADLLKGDDDEAAPATDAGEAAAEAPPAEGEAAAEAPPAAEEEAKPEVAAAEEEAPAPAPAPEEEEAPAPAPVEEEAPPPTTNGAEDDAAAPPVAAEGNGDAEGARAVRGAVSERERGRRASGGCAHPLSPISSRGDAPMGEGAGREGLRCRRDAARSVGALWLTAPLARVRVCGWGGCCIVHWAAVGHGENGRRRCAHVQRWG